MVNTIFYDEILAIFPKSQEQDRDAHFTTFIQYCTGVSARPIRQEK
jgi:hypothetical protein